MELYLVTLFARYIPWMNIIADQSICTAQVFPTVWSFLPLVLVSSVRCSLIFMLKGLKATNERQDDGAGILHQVAQFPIDQVHKEPMPLSAHARPRETCMLPE